MGGDRQGSPIARERATQIDCSHLKVSGSFSFRVSDSSIESRMGRTSAILGANDTSGVFGEVISTSGLVSIPIPPLCYLGPGCEKSKARVGGTDGVDVPCLAMVA